MLLDGDGHVRLTDFGLSRYFEQRPAGHYDPRLAAAEEAATSPRAWLTHSFCGTEQYMAVSGRAWVQLPPLVRYRSLARPATSLGQPVPAAPARSSAAC